MKNFIQILSQKKVLVLITFFIISKTSLAQQTEIKYDAPARFETVILKFPDINSAKVFSKLQTTLSALPGVIIRGRCPNADFLFLNVDRRYFPNNDDLLKKITDANLIFETIAGEDALKQNGVCTENELAK